MINAAALHEAVAAVCPIESIRLSGSKATVSYAPTATERQKIDARAIIDGWDFRERRAKPMGVLINDIAALANDYREEIDAAMRAEYIRNHPKFARGLGIDIDEVVI